MKTNNYATRLPIFGLLLALSLIGCGKKSGSSGVKVQFANNTASVLSAEMQAIGPRGLLRGIQLQSDSLLGVTPTIYQMKLVAFYLSEDIDGNSNNVGKVARIWTSSKCDDDLTLCGIVPERAGAYTVDYFDLSKGSAAVNAAFEAYTREAKEDQIAAGTYRYLRMDFKGKSNDEDTTPNLKFGTSVAHEVRAQDGAFTIELPEPLVLEEGESFTVDLAYDLENRFYESSDYYPAPAEVEGAGKWTCTSQGSGVPCIVEAPFSPTVTKK